MEKKLHQPLSGAAEELFEYSTTIRTIDTHEHIHLSEASYLKDDLTFGRLFGPYVSCDLYSAGMPFPENIHPPIRRIEDDFDAFEQYWDVVKHGSYARPLRIALQHFYGVDDFTRDNHQEIVEKIRDNHKPGIYSRVFKEECGIEKSILCTDGFPEPDDPILLSNINSPASRVRSLRGIEAMAKDTGASLPKNVDELIEISDNFMSLRVSQGAIEFKTRAMPVEYPDRDKADEALQAIMSDEPIDERSVIELSAYVREANAKKAAELDVPLAIHTGVWRDFRSLSIASLIGFIQRNPDTKMDIFHLGIPDVRIALNVIKNFPNAYLNLCWAHIVASDMIVNTMKEALDMIPVSKVFAFGADYTVFIEKIYGHLHVARENVAIVLGDRVDRNLMDLDEAKQILSAWFYDNPKSFYKI